MNAAGRDHQHESKREEIGRQWSKYMPIEQWQGHMSGTLADQGEREDGVKVPSRC